MKYFYAYILLLPLSMRAMSDDYREATQQLMLLGDLYVQTHGDSADAAPVVVHEDGSSSPREDVGRALEIIQGDLPQLEDESLHDVFRSLQNVAGIISTYRDEFAGAEITGERLESLKVRLPAAAAGIGGIAGLVNIMQQPTKRGIKSFILEKSLLLVVVGGAVGIYKAKSLWMQFKLWRMHRKNDALEKAIAMLQPAVKALEEKYTTSLTRLHMLEDRFQKLETESTHHYESFVAQLTDFGGKTQLLADTVDATFAEVRGSLSAIKAPVDDLQANQQAIKDQIGRIMAKNDEVLTAIRARLLQVDAASKKKKK